ncbi:MAG: hypothetical protein LUC24_02795 [Bacteroidales bacterium]|nr:hypothetical protein [Bacteroidales bacterium]
MTWLIIGMLFPLLLIALPWTLYKSRRPFMTRFYLTMVSSENARKLYIRCMLILMLLYHYVYAGGHPGEWGILPSTIMCVVMFSFKRADRLICDLYENRKLFYMIAMLTLAVCATPHLYTLAVVLGFFLLAAMFYPSCTALTGWQDEETRKRMKEDPDTLTGLYYWNHHADRHEYVDSGGETESTDCQTKNNQEDERKE